MLSALKPVRATLRHFSNLLLAIHRLLLWFSIVILKYEPPHDKTNKVSVHPAKTSTQSDQNMPGWSESSLSAWKKLGSLATHWAHSEHSDQNGSSLGAQPHCWFCHEAAHICLFSCFCLLCVGSTLLVLRLCLVIMMSSLVFVFHSIVSIPDHWHFIYILNGDLNTFAVLSRSYLVAAGSF